MIGVLLVTHGNFGIEIVKSAELIIGKQDRVISLTLNHGDDVRKLEKQIGESIKELNDGDGVIVITDFFGGSPSNATLYNMKDLEFKAVSGLNLPMLLELFCFRTEMDLESLIDRVICSGLEGIRDLNKVLES